MAETANLAEASAAPAGNSSPQAKKTKAVASKKPRVKPSHPPTSDMVNNAIKSLKERGGSSLQAIKKYLSSNYKIDAEKLAPFIKKYLKSAVSAGTLIQTKGKGASGSFKLSPSALKPKSEGNSGSGQKQVKKSVKKPHGDDKKAKSKLTAAKKKLSEKKKSSTTKSKDKKVGEKKKPAAKKTGPKSGATKAKSTGAAKPKAPKAAKSVSAVKKPKTTKPKKPASGDKKKPTAKKSTAGAKKN